MFDDPAVKFKRQKGNMEANINSLINGPKRKYGDDTEKMNPELYIIKRDQERWAEKVAPISENMRNKLVR